MSKGIELKSGDTVASRYVIKDILGRGGMGAVYRAMPLDDPSQEVAIKIIKRRKALDYDDIMRFQKEAALMSLLYHPNIICFHELGILGANPNIAMGWKKDANRTDLGDGYYIVMELSNGRDLKASLRGRNRKDIPYFFEVALQVASALDYTHGKNIIHRDIKPQNIVVGKAFGDQKGFTVKVLDFGVARLAELTDSASADADAGGRPSEIAGTPIYMAPEQTPYLQAPVDHRLDLYSLGCVFYEILMGHPPFEEDSREKLMHAHAYKQPISLLDVRSEIPEIINLIVMKLLAKHPDDRYQTAFGLYADLQRARIQLYEAKRQDVFFPLGLKDNFKTVSAQIPLIGKDKELDRIITNYKAVCSERGRSHMTVVSGDVGMGKTRILAEFRNYLVRHRIRFISVRFSRHENNLPYNALANGFNEYLAQLLKHHPLEARELSSRIGNVLGDLAHIVADKVPGLRPFITSPRQENVDIASLETLAPVEVERLEFQTFAKAFSDFIRCLAIENHPIVFVFDDIHWADKNSLALVNHFFSHNNSLKFYLLISYRSQALTNGSDLTNFLQKFRQLKRRYAALDLDPLSESELGQLQCAMLDCKEIIGKEFVAYLLQETNGIPMFAVELIRSLVAQELVNFNNRTKLWDFNLDQIRRNLLRLDSVDLTLGRIQTYPQVERDVLEVAAIIGMTFPFDLIAQGQTFKGTLIHRVIQKAFDEGLLIKSSSASPLKKLGQSYNFIHPRTRDAIVDGIQLSRKQSIHKRVAFALESHLGNEKHAAILYSIAHHFNSGTESNDTLTDQEIIFGVNQNSNAGKEAFRHSSLVQARHYFERAQALMARMKDNTLVLQEGQRIIEFLGDIEYELRNPRSAVKFYKVLLGTNIPRLKYVQIVKKLIHVTLYGGRISDAMDTIIRSLKFLKYPIPGNQFFYKLQTLYGLFLDNVPLLVPYSRLYNLAQHAYKVGSAYQKGKPRRSCFWGHDLYRQAYLLLCKENPQMALIYQETSLKEGFKDGVSPEIVLKNIGDRACLLSHLGNQKLAQSFMNVAIDTAKSLKLEGTIGYLTLYQCMVLDLHRGVFQDFDTGVRMSMNALSRSHDSFHYASARIGLILYDFVRGNATRIERAMGFIFGADLPFRNWLNPRGFAVYGLLVFLQNDHTKLVIESERYLKILAHAHYRANDLFVHLIRSLVSFARGESQRALQYYQSVFSLYFQGRNLFGIALVSQNFLPLEEDFVLLYLCIFPDLLRYEFQSTIAFEPLADVVYRNVDRRARHPAIKHRVISKLVSARCSQFLNKSKSSALYEVAIKESTANSLGLVTCLGLYWYGESLNVKAAKVSEQGIDQIGIYRRALHEAERLNLGYLNNVLKKRLADKNLYQFVQDPIAISIDQQKSKILTRALCNNLAILMEELSASNQSIDNQIIEGLGLVQKFYKAHAIYCFRNLADFQIEPISVPDNTQSKQSEVEAYLAPYLDLNVPLFLPCTSQSHNLSEFELTQKEHTILQQSDKALSFASTVIDSQNSTLTETIREDPRSDVTESVSDESNREIKPHQLVNAILPLCFGGVSLGTIFVEKLALDVESVRIKEDVQTFSAIMSMLLGARAAKPHWPTAPWWPVDGSPVLDYCSWLDVWGESNPSTKDESSALAIFTYGTNLSLDTYIVLSVSCRPTDVWSRELLSQLWFQLIGTLEYRSLQQMPHSASLVQNLMDLAKSLLLTSDSFSKITDVSMTSTLFSRASATVMSGQLGVMRPTVLGAENRIIPSNEHSLSLSNGQTIRYWELVASIQPTNFYVLPFSRVDLASIKLSVEGRNEPHLLVRRQLSQAIQSNQQGRPISFVAAYLRDLVSSNVTESRQPHDNMIDPINHPKLQKAE